MLTELEKDVLEIIKEEHIGYKNTITQDEITDIWNLGYSFGIFVSSRQVRKAIASLINQGYPIISTPRNRGGYHWQEKPEEGLECAKRIKRQAVKLFLKARKIRENSRVGQLSL
jgi:hypothetical protein